MKKSVAVLGLGRFGKSLAENLYRLGADVLVADSNEALVQDFSGKCTSAVCADLEMEEDVTALGLNNMDVVAVDMSNNLAASVRSRRGRRAAFGAHTDVLVFQGFLRA